MSPEEAHSTSLRLLVCLNEELLPLSGGGSAGNLRIIQELARRGHRLTVASPLALPPDQARSILGPVELAPLSPFRMHRTLPFRELRYLLYGALFQRHLGRLLGSDRYDAVLVRNCTLAPAVRRQCRRRGIPWGVSLTDLITGLLEEDDRYPHWLVHRLMRWERSLARSADRAFVLSREMARYISDPKDPPERFPVTRDGVDPLLFDPARLDPAALERVRGRIGWTRPFVLVHGILDPHRGDHHLSRLIRDCPEIPFVALANPEGLARLDPGLGESRLRRLPFVPYREVPFYLAAAGATVVPYPPTRALEMVFTLKLLESLAMGVPTVSLRRRCLEEDLPRMDHLILVDHPSDLPEALRRALALPGRPEAGGEIRRQLSWARVCDVIEQGLREMVR